MMPKFRAWDSEANIMIYSDHRTRKLYDVYYGFEMNGKGELECRWESDFTESHVLDGGILDNIMQSTGLKDKNGVEIYEGDVCRMSGGLEDYWYIVEWVFAGWQLVTYKKPDAKVSGISDGINQSYLEPDIACNLTIVGNIHANPELLSSGIE